MVSRGRSAADEALQSGLAMMRSASVSSFVSSIDMRSSSPVVQTYPEPSAKHHMKATKTSIDFSVASGENAASTWPVSWSANNAIIFGRGNRVYMKNLATTEDVAQLCKVRESQGDLSLIDCGGKDQPHIIATATRGGYIQIWDVNSKKALLQWQTTGALSLRWNGSTLTVGGPKGTIKHYDTRSYRANSKLKDVTRKVTRHQAGITSLAWNSEGKYLASGDEMGTILCWDDRKGAPLDVGELVQRRRKMQHEGVVTVSAPYCYCGLQLMHEQALAWCPWQPKMFASGDSKADLTGTIRVWNVNASTIHSTPDKLELDASVTSIHFSPHCKEILSTHGKGKATPVPPTRNDDLEVINHDPAPSKISNSIVVHSLPSLRHVTTLSGASTNIAGSLLSPNGHKLLLALPEESKLRLWDVWGKPTLKRQPSALSYDGRIR